MNELTFIPLVAFFVNIFLVVLVLKSNHKASANRIFSFSILFVALWSLGEFLQYTTQSVWLATIFSKFQVSSAVFVSAFILHFFIIFTKWKVPLKRGYILPVYIPAVIFSIFSMTTDLITAHPHLMPFGNVFDAGILYPLYLTYIAGCIFFGLMLSVRSFLKSDGVERKRNLFVIIGVSVPLVGGVLSAIFTILGVFNFPPTTTLSTVTVAFVSYAIIRYRLMSITTEIAAESMLRTMADYLVVLDRERKVAIISDSVKELTGKSHDELAGKSISEALGEKTHVLSKIMDDLERTGKTIKDRETYIMVKGGEYTSFSVNASVIKDGTGRVIGFVLIMRDMSQVKRLIKGIEEKSKELEKSKKQLEKNNEELATFNKMAVGRELKMIELKKKIEELQRKDKAGK